MKTKIEKYILAAMITAAKYRKVIKDLNEGRYNDVDDFIRIVWQDTNSCSYCIIDNPDTINRTSTFKCNDCPLSNSEFTFGCIRESSFRSLKIAFRDFAEESDYRYVKPSTVRHLIDMLERRIQFHLGKAVELTVAQKAFEEEALWSIEEEKKQLCSMNYFGHPITEL